MVTGFCLFVSINRQPSSLCLITRVFYSLVSSQSVVYLRASRASYMLTRASCIPSFQHVLSLGGHLGCYGLEKPSAGIMRNKTRPVAKS